MTDDPNPLLAELAAWMKKTEAAVGFNFDASASGGVGEFSAMATWGQEAPDSPMAGAAAYGLGNTFEGCLEALLDEAGARREPFKSYLSIGADAETAQPHFEEQVLGEATIDIRRADGTEEVLRCPVCMTERRLPVGWEEIMRETAPEDWDGILRCQNDHAPEQMIVLP